MGLRILQGSSVCSYHSLSTQLAAHLFRVAVGGKLLATTSSTHFHQSHMSDSSPPPKVRKTSNMSLSKIGTHNGTFHCDDVLACWMLKQLPMFKDAKIIRTRNPELLDTCDIVVDVGGKFDHESRRYDHHQREFKETYNSLNSDKPWKTKLSSAGLVYIYYGKSLVQLIMEKLAKENNLNSSISDDIVMAIYDKVYENLIEEIDGVDNGVSLTDETPRYKVTTTLSQRVGNLNPRWNEPSDDDVLMKRFEKAMKMVGDEFLDRVNYYQLGWLPAHDMVKDAFMKRFEVHPSGEVICLEGTGIPWKDHIMGLEKELKVDTIVKYVLYEDKANNKWRIQCVPVRADSFENRLGLPIEWGGLRDDDLSKISGIEGCVFVHSNRFIGGNATYKGVLEMASKSLEIAKQLTK